VLATSCRRDGKSQGDRRFANAGAANKQSIRTPLETTAQKGIEFRIPAWREIARERFMMFCRDEAGVNCQAAFINGEIMKAAAESDAAHFDDAQSPPFGSVVKG
jgi:hypothetical protein